MNTVEADVPSLYSELAGIRDALARLAALAQQTPEPQSSVEISRNAKGQAQFVVKVYAPMPAAACDLAEQLYDHLAERYNGHEADHA